MGVLSAPTVEIPDQNDAPPSAADTESRRAAELQRRALRRQGRASIVNSPARRTGIQTTGGRVTPRATPRPTIGGS